MLKFYHNPKCRKCREGLAYLKTKNVDFEIINYIENSISKNELKEVLLKLNLKPQDIIRQQEDYYKKELKGKNFTEEEWINILAENPRLIMRPIVTGKHKAVIATIPEKIDIITKTEK